MGDGPRISEVQEIRGPSPISSLTPKLPSLLLFGWNNQRHAVLRVADDDDLRVSRVRELLSRFDSFPRQQLITDPATDNVLEVGNTFRFDRFSFSLLAF